MVDMNVIVLEGIGLYIVLGIMLFMVIAVLVLATAGIKQDEKIEILTDRLHEVENSNRELNRKNLHYKLKYGELNTENE